MYIILSLILLFIGILFVFKWLYDNKENTALAAAICLLLSLVIIVLSTAVTKINSNYKEDTYYIPATIIGYNTTPTMNVTIFDTDNGTFYVDGYYEDDNVYLLTIDTCETKTPEDDMVVVVWETCEGALG